MFLFHLLIVCVLPLSRSIDIPVAETRGVCIENIREPRLVLTSELQVVKRVEKQWCWQWPMLRCNTERNKVKPVLRQQLIWRDRPVRLCCAGWKLDESALRCMPVCEQGCSHGNCTAPNSCVCSPGYSGHTCSEHDLSMARYEGHGNCSEELTVEQMAVPVLKSDAEQLMLWLWFTGVLLLLLVLWLLARHLGACLQSPVKTQPVMQANNSDEQSSHVPFKILEKTNQLFKVKNNNLRAQDDVADVYYKDPLISRNLNVESNMSVKCVDKV